MGLAPFIRRAEEGSAFKRIVEPGQFGLVPAFARALAFGRKTYNARSETAATLPSFGPAWRRGQRCIIPAEAIYEPCYETGRAVRYRIQQPGSVPMGIAGVWSKHPTLRDKRGRPLLSFAMLTVSGEGHPVFQRMQPGRIRPLASCSIQEAASFFKQWLGPLEASPEPRDLPPRPSPPQEGLF